MKLIVDSIAGQFEISDPDWNYIEATIHQISEDVSYFILERDENDYIQCAGKKSGLFVEVREPNDRLFKHWVIGLNPPSKRPVWTAISCKLGSVYVHATEVLSLIHAQALFKAFFYKENISPEYYKRNITKRFTER